MPNYSKCFIYKICCKDLSVKDIYIGSTCNFANRKCKHKSNCTNKNVRDYNFKVYKFIRDNGNWDNWDMILIEEYSCENKKQKLQRERHWYEIFGPTLNNIYPERSHEEWYQDNKEHHAATNKKWRESNKESIAEKGKEYREKNKEKIAVKTKEYEQQNKEKIAARKKEKITCLCGSVFCKRYKPIHERSKKHIDYINHN